MQNYRGYRARLQSPAQWRLKRWAPPQPIRQSKNGRTSRVALSRGSSRWPAASSKASAVHLVERRASRGRAPSRSLLCQCAALRLRSVRGNSCVPYIQRVRHLSFARAYRALLRFSRRVFAEDCPQQRSARSSSRGGYAEERDYERLPSAACFLWQRAHLLGAEARVPNRSIRGYT